MSATAGGWLCDGRGTYMVCMASGRCTQVLLIAESDNQAIPLAQRDDLPESARQLGGATSAQDGPEGMDEDEAIAEVISTLEENGAYVGQTKGGTLIYRNY